MVRSSSCLALGALTLCACQLVSGVANLEALPANSGALDSGVTAQAADPRPNASGQRDAGRDSGQECEAEGSPWSADDSGPSCAAPSGPR